MMNQENTYTLADIAEFTALSDRTLRKYLSSGILTGEMVDGVWRFSAEDVGGFINHPGVRPSIVAKSNGLIYDFLADRKKVSPKACVVLDLPGTDHRETSEYFCKLINEGGYDDVHFSFHSALNAAPRVILTGSVPEVMDILNKYSSR